MHFGVQLEAPTGFGAFRQGTSYYFAGDAEGGHVHLAWFHKEPEQWRVHLITLPRSGFEPLLTDEPARLVKAKRQRQLPEWLEALEAKRNLDGLERCRPGEPKETYRQQVEGRLMKIAPALELEDEILASADPIKRLNKIAYAVGAAIHPHRFALWFFAYVLHGRDFWSLKRPTQNMGTWSRTSDEHRDRKFGRQSSDKESPFNSPASSAAKRFEGCYLKRCGLGVTMKEIYWDSMIEDFGCVAIKDKHGNLTLTHPSNGQIYSYGQFRYHVVERLGLRAVQVTLYGEARVRNKQPFNEGNQTAQYGAILEGFEVDAYYSKDRPTMMFTDDPAEALAVARGICCKTSAVAGVGFAIGAENKEAYRAMLFCCVTDKSYVARMYGIPPEHLEDWITLGLPPKFRSDRGPAGYRKLVDDLQLQFPMKSVGPSYTPRSRASVEASHPRSVKTDGAPSYVQSDLNTPEMIKREVYRARADNFSSSIADKLTDAEINEFATRGWAANPHNYCRHLLGRLATRGRNILLHDAVRVFWTPTKFTVDKEGVHYRHRYFTSTEFQQCGVLERLGNRKSIELDGYRLSAVFLIVWVEFDGKLIEVEAATRARVDGEDLLVPVSELEATATRLAEVESITRRSSDAAQIETRRRFQSTTGKKWSAGRRRGGTPKRAKGAAAHESTVAKGKTRAPKAA